MAEGRNENGDNILNNEHDNQVGNHLLQGIVHLPDAIKLVRKYDGRTSITEWLRKFETDILAFQIPYKYAVVSLDRFLVEDAEKWWCSVSHQYNIHDLNRSEEEFREVWDNVCDDMRAFFNRNALMAVNKRKNKEIIFKIGDDPQRYVTSKVAILKEIDVRMDEAAKVKNLIRGLPLDLRLQFSSENTIGLFLDKLRTYAEIVEDSRPKSSHSQKNSNEQASSSQTIRAIGTGQSQNRPRNNPAQNANRPRNCFHCNDPGHLIRDCPHRQQNAQQNDHANGNAQQQAPPNAQQPRNQNQNHANGNNGGGRGNSRFFAPQNFMPFQMPFYNPYFMNPMMAPFCNPFFGGRRGGGNNNGNRYHDNRNNANYNAQNNGNQNAQNNGNLHGLGGAPEQEPVDPPNPDQGNE